MCYIIHNVKSLLTTTWEWVELKVGCSLIWPLSLACSAETSTRFFWIMLSYFPNVGDRHPVKVTFTGQTTSTSSFSHSFSQFPWHCFIRNAWKNWIKAYVTRSILSTEWTFSYRYLLCRLVNHCTVTRRQTDKVKCLLGILLSLPWKEKKKLLLFKEITEFSVRIWCLNSFIPNLSHVCSSMCISRLKQTCKPWLPIYFQI